MASNKRKSTDSVQRKAIRQVDAEIREITPQEKRRNFFIQVGVWFLVIAFCMTSGIMCFAIGSNEQQEQAETAREAKDELQSEIDRYQKEVSADARNVEALANLGYYWMQKGDTLPTAENLKQEAKTKAAIDANLAKDGNTTVPKEAEKQEKQMSREEAYAHARENFEKALAIDGNYLFAKRNLADLEMRENHKDKASALYKQIVDFCGQPIKLNPGDDEATIKASRDTQKVGAEVELARIYAIDNKNKEALSLLEDAVKLDPGNVEAYHVKALIHLAEKDLTSAHKAFDSAILISSNMGDINQAINFCLEQAQVYKSNNQKDKAKQTYQKAKDLIPANMGPQAEQMRTVIQSMIDQLDGKKPAPAPKSSSPAPAKQATGTAAPAAASEQGNAAPAATSEQGNAAPAATSEQGNAAPAATSEQGNAAPAATSEQGNAAPAATSEQGATAPANN